MSLHLVNQRVAVLGVAALLATGVAVACPIPVFQFSLEYWESDPFRIEVRHNGNFNDDQQEARARLEAAAGVEGEPANIALSWRDYSQADIAPPEGMDLPYMIVRYPAVSGINSTLWEGPLTTDDVSALLDSPARRQISQWLLERHAAVWVLLRSGNRSADREAMRLLEAELPRMEQTLKVPDPGIEGMDLGDIYTDIRFKLVAISRDDPEEQFLVRMLLGTEPDLDEFEDQPIVFPIYGRGLVMYALVGAGINRWTLNSAGEFLVGPCSCQIKQSNPGIDLLTSLDWAGQVERLTTYGEAPVLGASGFLDRMDEAEERLRED